MTTCSKCAKHKGFLEQQSGFATIAIHTSQHPSKWKCTAVVPPITLASTFQQPCAAEHKGYIYGRVGNPMRDTLEECLAALEGGCHGFTFSSGLAAITAVFMLLSKGDHVISIDDLYGGTNVLLSNIITRLGIEVTLTDITKPGNLEKAMKKNTKMLWFETPTNPTMKVVDIAEAVKKVKSCCNDIIVAVDNTFLTSYLQKPLNFGADIVVYSVTKYINGHTDVVMGAAVCKDKAIAERLRVLQTGAGFVPSPFDCYLVNRSLKTLALRMDRHKESGLLIAGWLDMHPKVVEVLHPGLPTHKHHEIAKMQSSGHSGVFSFRHSGGLKESRKFLSCLKLFILAVSLGGYESLAELPSVMTHANVPEKQRADLGITHSLIRLSVGLEDVEDLIEDLDRAFRETFQ